MSASLVDGVFAQSQSTGRARLVLVALAHCASHEAFTRYGEKRSWPSRTTLARMAGIPDSPKGPNVAQVHRELRRLEELGEIAWSGETKGKGAKVYEILLDIAAPDPVTRDTQRSRVSRTRDTQTSRVADDAEGWSDDPGITRDVSPGTRDTQTSRRRDTQMSPEPEGTGSDLKPEEEQARASTARGGGDEVERGDRYSLDGRRLLLRTTRSEKVRREVRAEIAELEAEAVR